MNKILLSIAATAALTAAVAPAAAQTYGHQGRGGYSEGRGGYSGIDMSYYDSLQWKLQNAAQERRISWGEAQSLRNQLSQLHDAAWRVHTGEARGGEQQRVQQAVSRAEAAINSRYARNDGDRSGRNWNR